MKTFTRILVLFSIIALVSCQGEEGPMGPQGEDGINIVGTVYQIQGSFTSANNYILHYNFPKKLVDGDAVMVYIRWEQTKASDGSTLNVWRPLPQATFTSKGTFQYNFDYTVYDIQILLEGTLDPASLSSADKDNQLFRVAVIPADLAKNKSVDLNDYNAVVNSLKLNAESVQNIQPGNSNTTL